MASSAPSVFGSPMTQRQQAVAKVLLNTAKQQRAPLVVMQALIFAAIMESTMGADMQSAGNPHVGPLQGQQSDYSSFSLTDPALWQKQAGDFINGIGPFKSALVAAGTQTDPGKIAAIAEGDYVSGSSLGPSGYGQYFSRHEMGLTGQALMNAVVQEAVLIVQRWGGGGFLNATQGITPKNNSSAPFYVGGPNNPNEDVWTAINRLAQERYWYLFSDGETVYIADGNLLIQQPAALLVDRWKNADRILHLDFTWDNTAWQYAANTTKKRRQVRKSQLAKVQSPVEANLQYICNIDEVRAGDVIELSGCGPGDGKWIVGDARRSIFQVYSEFTLVPAIKALSESQAAGGLGQTSNADVQGAAASAPGAGTLMTLILSAAATLAGPSNDATPYIFNGGHQAAGTPDIGSPGPGYNGTTKGFDAAGAVAAVFSAAGMWTKQGVPDPSGVVSALQTAKFLVPGQGSGNPEVTVFINNHYFFLRINGRFWGTADGTPIKKKITQTYSTLSKQPPWVTRNTNTTTIVTTQDIPRSGGSWLEPPPDLGAFTAYHVPPTLLGQLSDSVGVSANVGLGTYVNPFGQCTGLVKERVDMGVDFNADAGSPILAAGAGTVYAAAPGGTGWTSPGNTQAFVGYTLSDGPYAGKHIYVAEDITLTVSENQPVVAGQTIAKFKSSSTGLETGWGNGQKYTALAAALNQQAPGSDPGAWTSAMGASFANFLKSLNQATYPPGAPHGKVPPGYPAA